MKKKDNKNNESNKTISILYILSAICFYIVAMINFLNKESSMGVIYICLGSTFLCLGSTYINKDKDQKKK